MAIFNYLNDFLMYKRNFSLKILYKFILFYNYVNISVEFFI